MNQYRSKNIAMAGLLAGLLLIVVGCGEGDPPVSQKTKDEQSKLSEIRDRTGYDWAKTTDADKAFLRDTCHGDESCAKGLLFKPSGAPKGPPQPGGGPPAAVGG